MSKSLGNMVFIRDALKEHSADALRWYLLLSPYRDDLHYEASGPAAAERQVEQLREALRAPGGPEPALDAAAARAAFLGALDMAGDKGLRSDELGVSQQRALAEILGIVLPAV
jgi:L-cysteine:1D-myo-inositol 2-amino-2-deoxy-alpha-D-glucopyranoside ligase